MPKRHSDDFRMLGLGASAYLLGRPGTLPKILGMFSLALTAGYDTYNVGLDNKSIVQKKVDGYEKLAPNMIKLGLMEPIKHNNQIISDRSFFTFETGLQQRWGLKFDTITELQKEIKEKEKEKEKSMQP